MYPYKTVTVVTDNGPYITKLILKAPEPVRAETVNKDTSKMDARWRLGTGWGCSVKNDRICTQNMEHL